jgi:hypothetical protein
MLVMAGQYSDVHYSFGGAGPIRTLGVGACSTGAVHSGNSHVVSQYDVAGFQWALHH